MYEMVTDCVVPAQWEVYLANKQTLLQAAANNPEIRSAPVLKSLLLCCILYVLCNFFS